MVVGDQNGIHVLGIWWFVSEEFYCKASVVFLVNSFMLVQEAMESPAFPHIIELKLMNLKMYILINIFLSPKIMLKSSKLYVFALETSRKHLFPFSLLLTVKCINKQGKLRFYKCLPQKMYFRVILNFSKKWNAS